MIYHDTLEFANDLDAQDELKNFRNEFLFPQHDGKDAIYLCGNSLGLQPKSVQQYVQAQLSNWQEHGVEGWFHPEAKWLEYHLQLKEPLSKILGAKTEEITVMNSLTVNLHLLLVSFYKPINNKYKILMEGGAFPSDQYAIESQVKFHGFDPKDAIIEVFPREGEYTLRTEDILSAIENNADELALVMFSGLNYYTGQVFDMKAIAGQHLCLCPQCTKLLHHAFVKRTACPRDPKPQCKDCPTHCYAKVYREQIREVMRFSGMRLLLRGRIDYLFHLFF